MEKARKAQGAFELDLDELVKVSGGNSSDVPEKRKGPTKAAGHNAVLSALSKKVKNVSMYTPESDD